MSTAEAVIIELSNHGRICPMPRAWDKLWKLLRQRENLGAKSRLQHPLILAGWNFSSDSEKQERFHAHLRWAESHDAMDPVISLLDTLEASEWLTTPFH